MRVPTTEGEFFASGYSEFVNVFCKTKNVILVPTNSINLAIHLELGFIIPFKGKYNF